MNTNVQLYYKLRAAVIMYSDQAEKHLIEQSVRAVRPVRPVTVFDYLVNKLKPIITLRLCM